MHQAKCPGCGYLVGLGVWSEPGTCPRCELPLMLTAEFRAVTPEEVLRQARLRAKTATAAAPKS